MTEVQGGLVVAMQGNIREEGFDALYQAFSQRLVDSRLSGAVLNFSGV